VSFAPDFAASACSASDGDVVRLRVVTREDEREDHRRLNGDEHRNHTERASGHTAAVAKEVVRVK
jgi:hypothetical protein